MIGGEMMSGGVLSGRLPVSPGSIVRRPMSISGAYHYGIASDEANEKGEQMIYQFGGPVEDSASEAKVGFWARVGDRFLAATPGTYTTDEVSAVRMSVFADGRPIEVVEQPRDPVISIQRARSMLGQAGYNPLTQNCEHYARWAALGTPRSEQARKFTARLLLLFAGVGALISGRWLYRRRR